MQRVQKWVLGFGLMGGLLACSSMEQDETVNWSAEKLYQTAKTEMNDGAYGSASKYYTKLLARYPFGRIAQQATLDLAYAYYRDGETEKAQAEIENFIRTYPQHPYIDYAYYMRGVFAYEKDVSIFDRLNPINMAQTDPQPLKQAFNYFDELVRRFPQSEYAEDARLPRIRRETTVAGHLPCFGNELRRQTARRRNPALPPGRHQQKTQSVAAYPGQAENLMQKHFLQKQVLVKKIGRIEKKGLRGVIVKL